MLAKVQKKYILTLGSNQETPKERLDEIAFEIEQYINRESYGVRAHIEGFHNQREVLKSKTPEEEEEDFK